MRQKANGFTLIEVMVVILMIIILGALFIGGLGTRRMHVCRIYCASNLKQVVMAFQFFSNDHDSLLPQQLSQAKGGTLEVAGSASALEHFMAASSELGSPKVLVCPQDTKSSAAWWDKLRSTNVSYALFIDSVADDPTKPFVSDANIILRGKRGAVVQITDPTEARWGVNMHTNKGNIAFSDGHTEFLDNEQLQKAMDPSFKDRLSVKNGQAVRSVTPSLRVTNRLAYPQ